MKNVLLILFVIFQFAIPAQAEMKYLGVPHNKSHNKPHQHPESLLTILQIDSSQSNEFIKIMSTEKYKIDSLHKSHESNRTEMHRSMKEIHHETIEQLSSLLSEAQIAAFKEFTAQHRPKPRHPMGSLKH